MSQPSEFIANPPQAEFIGGPKHGERQPAWYRELFVLVGWKRSKPGFLAESAELPDRDDPVRFARYRLTLRDDGELVYLYDGEWE